MSKGLWDRQGANIASRKKKMYNERLFRRPKKKILKKDQRFFVIILSEMDLGNVYTWKE